MANAVYSGFDKKEDKVVNQKVIKNSFFIFPITNGKICNRKITFFLLQKKGHVSEARLSVTISHAKSSTLLCYTCQIWQHKTDSLIEKATPLKLLVLNNMKLLNMLLKDEFFQATRS